jgi:Zn-dependent peptidase ImmA (M78 family)
MINTINPNMLVLAREVNGLNQKELSSKVGITQGALSKIELGLLPASKEMIESFSKELGFPASFFVQDGNLYEPTLYYRRKYRTSKKILSRAKAEMNLIRISVQQLLKTVELDSPQIPYFDVETDGAPETIAKKLRDYWQVPKGPIGNLISLIESKGIVIIYTNFDSDDVSGSGMFTIDRVPIIYINANMPMCRKRFTICHELFHILAHVNSSVDESRDIEKEANRFASEFLMPSDTIYSHLTGRITVSKLADLKKYWKTSMSSILVKANSLHLITERHYRTLWTQMAPFKKNEPKELEPPTENPKIIPKVIDLIKKELDFSDDELAHLLNMNIDSINKRFKFDNPRLRISSSNFGNMTLN